MCVGLHVIWLVVADMIVHFLVVNVKYPWSLLDVHDVGSFKRALATINGFERIDINLARPGP